MFLIRLIWIDLTIFHPGGELPYKSDGGAVGANRKINIIPLRETNVGVAKA